LIPRLKSLTYRSYTGDYIGKFTFHTLPGCALCFKASRSRSRHLGVRNDVPGGGGGDCKGWGKMFLHESTARKKVL